MKKSPENFNKNIKNTNLEQIISQRYGSYARYIIQERALPDVRDGLKPVQRRILYAMHELGIFHNKSYKKSARIVGEVIGKYHPHGDSSIYDALIRMAQEWKMNMPLIQVHGNKGSIDGDSAAAMRYTETRLSALASQMMGSLKKNTVRFTGNFDDSEIEPTVLPALFPNLLVNGAVGIAAGYATEMPPHNSSEIIDAIIAKIKNPSLSLQEVNAIVKGPDFPTGGIVQGQEGIFDAFALGNGKISIRAKLETVTRGKKTWIKVCEIPFGTIKKNIIDQICNIISDNQINGIKSVHDESGREHFIQIMIELNENSDIQQIINYLFAKTDLQVYYHYNNVVIKDGRPQSLGILQIIDAYLEHQHVVQKANIEYDLKRYQKRAEIIEGLLKAITNAKEIVNLIVAISANNASSKQAVIDALQSKFMFTNVQAEAISELKLYRFSKTDKGNLNDEQKDLETKITYNQSLLASSQAFDEYLINLLNNLKAQFPQQRRTEIQSQITKTEIDLNALIKQEETWVGVSRQGYIKRFSNRVFEGNELVNYGLKENDSIVYLKQVNTIDKLLVFTSCGHFIFIPVHKIEEIKWKDIGKHLNDFATIMANDYVVDVVAVNDFNLEIFLVLMTKNGKGKRVALKDFAISRASKAWRAIRLSANDALVNVRVSNGKKQIVIITKNNKALRYHEKELPIYSLSANGVKAINLSDDDYVCAMAIVSSNSVIGFVTNRGGLKRMRAFMILQANKFTKGKHFVRLLKTYPHVVLDIKVVEPSTKVYFSNTTDCEIFNFKNVDISTINSGFSLLANSKIIDASIMNYERLSEKNTFTDSRDHQDDEQKFANAEEIIEKASQIDLEDIGIEIEK